MHVIDGRWLLQETMSTTGSAVEHAGTEKARLALVLMRRQRESFRAPGLAVHADMLCGSAVEVAPPPGDGVWSRVVRHGGYTEGAAHQIEQALAQGVPSDVRRAVYLATLNVTAQMDATGFASLLKKARAEASDLCSEARLAYAGPHSEALEVFAFCNSEVGALAAAVAPLVAQIPDISAQETLAVLLKLHSAHSRYSKEEFAYKANRTLEDTLPELFVHITKQGIDLAPVHRGVFAAVLGNAQLLDFVLFEGFDFVVRVVGALFKAHEQQLEELDYDELAAYVSALPRQVTPAVVASAVSVEPALVRYENEHHLMSANAVSGNDNELANLKEANEDLVQKIDSLKKQMETLQKTQDEIVAQSAEYEKRLLEAQEKRAEAQEQALVLQEKYARLTMKENLENTIKANEDMSKGNAELEELIAALEKDIGAMQAKLDKLEST